MTSFNTHPGADDAPTKETPMNMRTEARHGQDRTESVWDRRRMTATLVAIALCLLVLILAGSARAQSVVRAWGMGGASTAACRGLEAVVYNPANLAFSHGTTVGLAAAAVDIRNNAFSIDRYNAITGQYLDSADKARLLNDIPEDGMRLNAEVNASALGFQSGGFALSFSGIGTGQGNLDKDYFDLVLNGNQLDQTIDFNNTWGEGSAVGSAAVSYGLIVARGAGSQLSVGANARYLKGIYEMHVDEAYGSLHTSISEVAGEAYVATESAQGGHGYGLDLGLALQTAGGWHLGLAVDNVAATINWDRDIERREMRVDAADINLMNSDLNAAVSDADTTFTGSGYTTTLPRRARLGAARQFGAFVLAADYIQGLETRGLTSTNPLVNAGMEWRLTSFLQPRLGFSAGGVRGGSAAVGLGVKMGPWRMDAAAVARGGLSTGQSEGIGVALGSVLEF